MKYYIKNMVCNRCKSIVISELDSLDIDYQVVEIGEVTLEKKMSSLQHKKLCSSLRRSGFELISNHNNKLIENLKRTITNLETCTNEELQVSYSDFISMNIKDNFISLNTLFSEVEGITIEKYIIKQKIEQIKKMLDENHLNMAEIARKMHYTSVTQLSSQFKNITGLTPLHFKQLHHISFHNTDVN